MLAVDTNVLVYAHRSETLHHEVAKRRLVALAESAMPWAVPVFVLSEFVRVVTHHRVFTPPSPLAAALQFVEVLLSSPTAQLLLPTPQYPDVFRGVCESADARGNLVFDAQIVGLCAEHGIDRILTADRDFARFSQIATEWLA